MTEAAVFKGRAAVRAGILVTGTEVLTGVISDQNGPWLSEQLRDLGVDVAMITIVGDRPEDLTAELRHMADAGVQLIITSGGLGPTADDLTAELVGKFTGREMVLDEQLAERIFAIMGSLRARWPNVDEDALREANRKQAVIPEGATVLEPVGTAPGLIVPAAGGGSGPVVIVLPGPPRELQPMWSAAVQTEPVRAVLAGAGEFRRGILRLYGIPEAEIANTLRAADAGGLSLAELEITTCLRRGEIEVVIRYEPAAEADYLALVAFIAARHERELFSRDGATIDKQVVEKLVSAGATVAVAESCTGGLVSARFTDVPGSSAYFLGGAVAYSDAAKTSTVGVDAGLISEYGAVSTEVARALALGARSRFSAQVGIGVTGIAGPGGGTEDKPVGYVCFCVAYGATPSGAAERILTRSARLHGGRRDVRERSTTVVMHMLARVLGGESDP
jgi:nicotinamide-nucleotide amidase